MSGKNNQSEQFLHDLTLRQLLMFQGVEDALLEIQLVLQTTTVDDFKILDINANDIEKFCNLYNKSRTLFTILRQITTSNIAVGKGKQNHKVNNSNCAWNPHDALTINALKFIKNHELYSDKTLFDYSSVCLNQNPECHDEYNDILDVVNRNWSGWFVSIRLFGQNRCIKLCPVRHNRRIRPLQISGNNLIKIRLDLVKIYLSKNYKSIQDKQYAIDKYLIELFDLLIKLRDLSYVPNRSGTINEKIRLMNICCNKFQLNYTTTKMSDKCSKHDLDRYTIGGWGGKIYFGKKTFVEIVNDRHVDLFECRGGLHPSLSGLTKLSSMQWMSKLMNIFNVNGNIATLEQTPQQWVDLVNKFESQIEKDSQIATKLKGMGFDTNFLATLKDTFQWMTNKVMMGNVLLTCNNIVIDDSKSSNTRQRLTVYQASQLQRNNNHELGWKKTGDIWHFVPGCRDVDKKDNCLSWGKFESQEISRQVYQCVKLFYHDQLIPMEICHIIGSFCGGEKARLPAISQMFGDC